MDKAKPEKRRFVIVGTTGAQTLRLRFQLAHLVDGKEVLSAEECTMDILPEHQRLTIEDLCNSPGFVSRSALWKEHMTQEDLFWKKLWLTRIEMDGTTLCANGTLQIGIKTREFKAKRGVLLKVVPAYK